LGPARRPLLALVCLMVIAVAVVVSSVAFISPYETNSIVQASDQAAEARFAAQASKECAATLPKYRDVLAWGTDGVAIAGAAHQVDLLRQRLASINASEGLKGPLDEWLGAVQQFTADQLRYAAIIGPAVRLSRGRLEGRTLAPSRQLAAAKVRREVAEVAARADGFSLDLEVPACRLEPAPAV